MTAPRYSSHAEQLLELVRALPPERVLECTDPWQLFHIGLKTGHLDVTAGMATAALQQVQAEIRSRK